MHTLIAGEYNKKDVEAYDGNAFPDIIFTRNLEANAFTDIDWQKSKETFSLISNEYDKCFYNWKQSGYHGEFPEEEGEIQLRSSHLVTLQIVTSQCFTCIGLSTNSLIFSQRLQVRQYHFINLMLIVVFC